MTSTLRDWQAVVADAPQASQIVRANVVAIEEGPDGVRVRCVPDAHEVIASELLHPCGGGTAPLAVGDPVLLWRQDRESDRAVVLGRIGGAPSAPLGEPPDELVIEARHSLTLRVGDGSITLRADGKILIKGKDLVSRAQRTNRIKGGAVSIN